MKAQDVADVGVAPCVYGLVRVADDANVQVVARKLPCDSVLRHIRVLEFVNHEMDIAFLVLLRHIGHAIEELVGLQQQVVEIHGRALTQQVLVALIGAHHNLVPVAAGAMRQPFRA